MLLFLLLFFKNVSFAFGFAETKDSADIEPKMDIAIQPATRSFRSKKLFNHTPWIREMELKNVSSSFKIQAYGKCIFYLLSIDRAVDLSRYNVEVFCVNR